MAEKTLKTRIINKHATLSQWQDSPLVLKEGEIALAKITTQVLDETTGNILYVPRYLMKVGEGNKTFNDLQWLAAPASDVYAWAKKDKLAYDDMPDEVKNISGNASAAIAAAIAALKNDDKAVANQFVTAAVQTDGVVKVARRALEADDIPSLKADKITEGTFADDRIANASKWNAAATQAETNRADLTAVKTRVSDLETSIGGLEGAMHFIGVSTKDPAEGTAEVAGHTTWEKGDVVLYGNKEFVLVGTNGEAGAWHELGDETIYAIKADVEKTYATKTEVNSEVESLRTAIGEKASNTDLDTAKGRISALEATVNTETTGLSDRMTAVEDVAKTNTDNIALKANVADFNALKEKTLSGTFISTTNQFVAYNGDEIIFDCGGAE